MRVLRSYTVAVDILPLAQGLHVLREIAPIVQRVEGEIEMAIDDEHGSPGSLYHEASD